MPKTGMRIALEKEIAGNGLITLQILSQNISESVKACGSYLVLLTNKRILTVREGVYRPSSLYAEWSAIEPRTRPGGASNAYLKAKGERDTLNVAEFQRLLSLARNRTRTL